MEKQFYKRVTNQLKVPVTHCFYLLKYSPAIECQSLRVTEMAKRWGSCTEAGTVSLDWRLIYAPKRVAAYVGAHELAHLKVSNHSRKFWNLLSYVYGEHQREHDWLQKNEHLLGYKRPVLEN